MKKLFSLLLALALVFSLTIPAFAYENGSVNIEKDSKSITVKPDLKNYTSTDLFGNFKGVMPGDNLSEYIKIKNWAIQYDYVKVYMQAVPHNGYELQVGQTHGVTLEQNKAFLSQLTLTVQKNNAQGDVLYHAEHGTDVVLDDGGQLAQPTHIATLSRGQSMNLFVTLDVPLSMGNEYANAIGEVDWVFLFEGYNVTDNPKTGDYIMIAVAVMAVSAAALVILFVIKRRKKQ